MSRMAERKRLEDINVRLERVIANGAGSDHPVGHAQTIANIQDILNEHESKVSETINSLNQSQLDTLQRERDEARASLAEEKRKCNEEKKKLRKDIHSLREKNQEIVKQRDEFKSKYNETSGRLKAKREENEQLKDTLKEKINEMKEQNDQVTKDRDALKSKCDNLEQQLKEKCKFSHVIAQRLQVIKAQIIESNKHLAAKKILQQQFENKLKEFNREKKKLEEEIKVLKHTHNKAIHARLHQIESLEIENKAIKNQENSLNAKIKKLEQKVKDSEACEARLNRENREQLKYVRGRDEENASLQEELTKYKLLWQHFFGLDGDLKDEIDDTEDKVTQLEQQHNIHPPAVRRRRVDVADLSAFFASHNDAESAPLAINVPFPSPKHGTFELYNTTTNDHIYLKGITIRNNRGQSINLDGVDIAPQRSKTFSIGQRMANAMLAPDNFIEYADEKLMLFLCDSHENKKCVFPGVRRYKSLRGFDAETCPLKAELFGSFTTPVRGIHIKNQMHHEIILKDMTLENERGTIKVNVPNNKFNVGDKIRLVVVEGDRHKDPTTNFVEEAGDIIISCEKVEDAADALFLVDGNGKKVTLFDYEGPEDKNHNNRNKNGNELLIDHPMCLVM